MTQDRYLEGAKVGDWFRWTGIYADNSICEITRFSDNGIRVSYIHVAGSRKGRRGFTSLPQDIELLLELKQLELPTSDGCSTF